MINEDIHIFFFAFKKNTDKPFALINHFKVSPDSKITIVSEQSDEDEKRIEFETSEKQDDFPFDFDPHLEGGFDIDEKVDDFDNPSFVEFFFD